MSLYIKSKFLWGTTFLHHGLFASYGLFASDGLFLFRVMIFGHVKTVITIKSSSYWTEILSLHLAIDSPYFIFCQERVEKCTSLTDSILLTSAGDPAARQSKETVLKGLCWHQMANLKNATLVFDISISLCALLRLVFKKIRD